MTTHRRAVRSVASCLAAAVVAVGVLIPAWALAQQRGGPVIVLGFRAPDGDDDAATQVSAAVRRAVRAQGVQTPDDAPNLEQQIAAFGCDDAVPVDCLAQIANDLHASRLIWGSVRRQGRGRTAQLQIDVSLYDNTTHTNSGHDTATVARATAQDSDALRTTAQRMVRTVMPSTMSTGGGSDSGSGAGGSGGDGSGGAGSGGAGAGSGGSSAVVGTPGRPVPIRRIIGYGMLGLGGVALIVGVTMGVLWFGLDGRCSGDNHESECGGFRAVPYTAPVGMRPDTTAGVCSLAAGRTGTYDVTTETGAMVRVDWGQVAGACGTQFTLSGMAYGLGIAGLGLIGAGLAIALTDHTGEESASTSTSAARSRRAPRVLFGATPVVQPGYSGALFSLRF